MSEKDKDGWSHGTFVNLAKCVVANPTDFSDCETDIPEDQWSHGTFVNLAAPEVAPITDCSKWDSEPMSHDPSVAVSFADAESQVEFTKLVRESAPDLRLGEEVERKLSVLLTNSTAASTLFNLMLRWRGVVRTTGGSRELIVSMRDAG